ncbi:MAG: GAF domain-containing protein, partial [Desulfobacteraceae bacterium]|nr:GAF domain-containing protein [Desulfobacteraceae bacterium]
RAQDAETESKAINKVLFSISNAVNTTENLNELYKSIHKTLGSIIDVTNFMIGIYDHEKDTISYPYYKDEIDDDYNDIQNVSKSGIIASEVINLAMPFFISRDQALARAKKIGADIVGKVAEQWLGIPLIIKREVIGVIVVQSYSNPELYSQKDVEILLSVSDQIAMAIDRKKEEEARKKSEEINKTLFEISNAVNTTQNLEELCNCIHDSLEKVVYVKNFSLALYDKKIDRLSRLYSCDETLPPRAYLENASQSNSMVFEVIRRGSPLLLTEQGQTELVEKFGGEMIGTPAKSWLCVPLKVKKETIGALLTQDYTTENCYKKEDIELLTLVSDQIAIAVDRKRSQDELQNSEKLTRTLFKISNAINTTSNLDDLFKVIHEALAEVIDVTNFAIGIYDSEKDIMSYPYYVDETGDSYNEIHNVSASGIIASEVINLAKPFFITGAEILERAKKIEARITEEIPPEQWLGVPLKTKNKVIGVIVVQSYSNPALYSQKDADILTAISDQIATA